MGKIKQDIPDYIQSLARQGLKVVFCHGFNKPVPQTKPDCKLMAAEAVQNYLVYIQRHSQPNLPVHKEKMFSYSLRQRAKEVTHSKVGEVYGPSQMQEILSYNDFKVTSYCIIYRDVYAQFLIQALSQYQPVLVYFDVAVPLGYPEEIQGTPIIKKGQFEHCAAIVGYYYDIDKHLWLIAAQLGEFYTISCDQLFDSTSQLRQYKQPETYQKYYPIPGFFHHKKWLDKNQVELALDNVCNNEQGFLRSALSCINELWPKDGERTSAPPYDRSGSLANMLTVISGDAMTTSLDEFRDFQLFFDKKLESNEGYQARPYRF